MLTPDSCSICIATFNHGELLDNTLASIFAQRLPAHCEVIVANDGSTDHTAAVLAKYPVVGIDLPRKSHWRNPVFARNATLRRARGTKLVLQSDDIIHETPDAVRVLCETLTPGCFVLGAVRHENDTYVADDPRVWWVHGKHQPATHMFLGAVLRSDAYAIGGFDLRFGDGAWFDDDWFELCLIKNGIRAIWCDDVVGVHQAHAVGEDLAERELRQQHNEKIFNELKDSGPFVSASGPWELTYD